MSTLTQIPSPFPCSTEQWILTDGDMDVTFQVHNGLIEHTSDIINFYWAKKKDIHWVQKTYDMNEQDRLNKLRAFRQNHYTEDQKRQMLYAEEIKQRREWMERTFEGTELRDWDGM